MYSYKALGLKKKKKGKFNENYKTRDPRVGPALCNIRENSEIKRCFHRATETGAPSKSLHFYAPKLPSSKEEKSLCRYVDRINSSFSSCKRSHNGKAPNSKQHAIHR
jgi:hypothetical protein